MAKHRTPGPRELGWRSRQDFSEARLLGTSAQKGTKFLNPLIRFSSVNSNLLTFGLPALQAKTPIHPGFFSGLFEMTSPSLRS